MTTDNQSAVVQLFRDVKTFFGSLPAGNLGREASVVFGMRERWKQINEGTGGANRVVFVPGTIPDGKDGRLEGPTGPGESIGSDGKVKPRALFDHKKIITICVWAADPLDPNAVDETAQQEAIEQLFEYVMQAFKQSSAGLGNINAGAPLYNPNPNERRFGIEYRIEIELDTRIFDQVPNVVYPTGARVSRTAGLV